MFITKPPQYPHRSWQSPHGRWSQYCPEKLSNNNKKDGSVFKNLFSEYCKQVLSKYGEQRWPNLIKTNIYNDYQSPIFSVLSSSNSSEELEILQKGSLCLINSYKTQSSFYVHFNQLYDILLGISHNFLLAHHS